MVKQKHKIVSLILCVILAVSAVCAGTVGAFAASGDTVYVKVNNGWTNLHCYMWTDNAGDNASWPGEKMTKVSDDVYAYTITGDYNKVIFNNGSGGNGNQTANLDYPGNKKIWDLANNSWSDYEGAELPASTTKATTATTATKPSVGPTTSGDDNLSVYLKNEAGWSTVKCYMWNSETDTNAAWPGAAMTKIGDNVYQYTASKAFKNCIFNGGSDANKTTDLVAKYGQIYNNKTNTWEVYDTSPLQVTSYSAEPSNGVYVDTDVTVSATAQNKNGAAVSYKFSVTNANGGTSVLSDFSNTNSVVWTPAAAGEYTITFDFKDTEGNENSRTASITVEDDSQLVKPVIKSVSPADFNLIKVNRATTVSVKAGGGKTGTNLLFYKYVVTDPNGVKNTPYYTLNSTYQFTPAMEGKYTVNVYVQGSDNSTVNKTYSYTATNSDVPAPTTKPVPSTTAPVPTTTKPVPTTTAPVPTTTKPVETTAPVPTTTKPVDRLVGDSDGDGELTVKDATYIMKSIVELPDVPAVEDLDLAICDVDRDGEITVKDATTIQLIIIEVL